MINITKEEKTLEFLLKEGNDGKIPIVLQDMVSLEVLDVIFEELETVNKQLKSGLKNFELNEARINCKQNSLLCLVTTKDNAKTKEDNYSILQKDKAGELYTKLINNRLMPIVTQDSKTKKVLILSFANREAIEKTLETCLATYWSRSRNELWVKGKGESGDLLQVNNVLANCNQDSMIYSVTPLGKGTCHTKDSEGNRRDTCYYRMIECDNGLFLLKYI